MDQQRGRRVVVAAFGGPDVLKIIEEDLPQPGPGQVRVALTSIGMNHADLMARRGAYKLSSGDPPFTPGLEGGGVIDAVGGNVEGLQAGQRVIVGPQAPRLAAGGSGGTYRSHYLCAAAAVWPAPDNLPDDHLGAVWLAYLTAWGCLVWKHRLRPGAFVALPAASSAVALAAAQIVRRLGAVAIGMTTSPGKVDAIKALPGCAYEHVVLTRDAGGHPTPWHQDLKRLTAGHGVDVFFDPVAAGAFLDSEIRCLAQFGTVWVYGLLGRPDKVDVTPLIRKHGTIRGWALAELIAAGREAFDSGCRHILEGIAAGDYRLHVDLTFKLADVRQAHERMEQGRHIGKLVLVP